MAERTAFIVGLVGGIASGKSFWARRFAECGCGVVDADALVTEVYQRADVLETLRGWWGDEVVKDGLLNRSAVAHLIFSDPAQRLRLEALVHPLVARLRESRTGEAVAQGKRAVVWDIPLLIEVGLRNRCDRVVFVEAPLAAREARAARRGWSPAELAKREAAQVPIEEKRGTADVVVGGEEDVSEESGRRSVQELLSAWGV